MDARTVISTAVHFLNEVQIEMPSTPHLAYLRAAEKWAEFARENELDEYDTLKGTAVIKRFANVDMSAKEVRALYYKKGR